MKQWLKAKAWIVSIILVTLLLLGASRAGRKWVSRAGGLIQYTRGNVEITNDNLVLPSGNIVASNQIWSLKTITKTISIVIAGSVDDFQFDDTQANNAEQSINLGALVPAWGELVSAQVRCIEAYVSSGADPDNITSLDIGVSSGAGDILAAGTPDDINDFITTPTGSSPLVASTEAAKNIWINLVPEDFFNTISAGRWAIIITYIDNGAAYTWAAP